MKKILLLTDIFYATTAGAEQQIVELCKNIDKEKYQIYVTCLLGHANTLEIIEQHGIKTYRLGVTRIYSLDGIKRGIKFARFLREEKIDILMTYHFGSDIFGSIFGKSAGVPVIISNRRDMGFWKKQRHIIVYRILDRLVNKIVVNSNGGRKAIMLSEDVSSAKIQVIYNGINLMRFEKAKVSNKLREEIGVSSIFKLIGCVGNIREVKGHIYLIEAMSQIIKREPDTTLLLIGGYGMEEKNLKEELEQQAQQLGISKNIRFLGPRKDVPELLKIMDICVLPSLSEGLSNTLLEYMAAGKPVVATDVGGNSEVINDTKSGLLVRAADAQDLSDKILYLLNNSEECKRLGAAAREDVARRFEILRMAREYEVLFDNMLATSRK